MNGTFPFDFAPGVTVTVNTDSLSVPLYTGELIRIEDGFLLLRLTAPAVPFVLGQVVRIALDSIVSVA